MFFNSNDFRGARTAAVINACIGTIVMLSFTCAGFV